MLPGITGLWQVSGKNKLTFQKMIRLDIHYYTHMSLLQDIKIMLLTVPAVLGYLAEAILDRTREKLNREQKKSETLLISKS